MPSRSPPRRRTRSDPLDPFHALTLDGSALPAAHAALYRRCADILSRAIAQKSAARGCFARPESDVPLLSLQAVAVQRLARRHGLTLDVPPDAPNDPDLVAAPDPATASLPRVPLPGIDLVTNSPTTPLAWPALYLDHPVHTVIDPPAA